MHETILSCYDLSVQELKLIHQKQKIIQIQKMNTEEIEIMQQQEQENNENCTGIITFNQKLFEKIMATDLSLKDPRTFMKKLDEFLTRKSVRYFKLYTTEQLVQIQHLQGNIRLRLMTREIIDKFLSEIPTKDKKTH